MAARDKELAALIEKYGMSFIGLVIAPSHFDPDHPTNYQPKVYEQFDQHFKINDELQDSPHHERIVKFVKKIYRK